MTNISRSRCLTLALAVLVLLGVMAIMPAAAEGSTAPESVGTVVLSEDFSTGTVDQVIVDETGATWNSWEIDTSYVEGTNVKDTFITIANGQETAILNATSAPKMPLEQFAEIKRTTSNSSSALYFAKKAVSVPTGNALVDIRFRVMPDSNANAFMLRFVNGSGSIGELTFTLYRPSSDKFIFSGIAEQITSTDVKYRHPLSWYDIDCLLDYTNSQAHVYVDGVLAGSSALTSAFLTAYPNPESIVAIEFGSLRSSALRDGTNEGNFYLDDLVVTVIPESDRGGYIAQKLRRYVPGGVSSVNTVDGKALTSTLTLPTEAYGAAISWSSSNAEAAAVSGGTVTLTHPQTGEDVAVTLTASITPTGGTAVSYTYPLVVAQYGVWLTENFEGSFAEKGSTGISGWNGWYNSWLVNDTQKAYTTTETVKKEADGNHYLQLYRLSDSTSSPSFQLRHAFGRTLSSAVATEGLSIKFRVKTGSDATNMLNIQLGTSTLATINMMEGAVILNTGGRQFFCAPFDTLNAEATYPNGGAIAGKWYDIEIFTEMAAGGVEKLYVDGRLVAETTRSAAITGSYFELFPNRVSMGAGGEYLFDDISVKQLTADEKALQTAADAITLFDETLYSDVTLPSTVGDGISVSWTSGDTTIIGNDGKIASKLPDFTTITGTFSKNGESLQRTYTVSVGSACAVELASVSAVTKTATCNIHAATLTGASKLIIGAYQNNTLLGVGSYDVSNAVGTYTADLSGWWTEDIPADAEIKAFVLDAATYKPQVAAASRAAGAKTLWLCGASTAASYVYPGKSAEEPEERRIAGWGEYLAEYFDSSKLVIENYAVSGRRARVYYQNEWITVRQNLKAGDYVLIQFGHNDQKDETDMFAGEADPRAASLASYETYLTHMVNEAREKGAIPILATCVNRRVYVNGVFSQTLCGYPEKMIEVAEGFTEQVPVLDLYDATGKWLTETGEADTVKYYRYLLDGTDNTHFTPMGARKICDMAVAALRENSDLTELAACLKS